jgi:perosamine synthetase
MRSAPAPSTITATSHAIPLSAPDITPAEIDAVTAVLRTPHLSLGPELAAFEAALAAYHQVPHAVAVSSGTAGLHLALLTLGIGLGDEVIVPSFTFIAVANAVFQVGATPVLADIDPLTLNLDPSAAERAINPRTRAIIAVHTFGVPADLEAFQSLARRHNLLLIEDACEAIGATLTLGSGPAAGPQRVGQQRVGPQRVGSFGDLAVLGFYPNKQITTGEGGAVLARDPAHAVRLRSLRNQGRAASANPLAVPDWLDHAEPGFNYRLSEMACALGRVQLPRIDEILAMRQAAAQSYHALFTGAGALDLGLELPPIALPDVIISWFVYVVRLPHNVDRDQLRARLAAMGIATGRYFAPIHWQGAWQSRASQSQLESAQALPVTEDVAPRTLALPFFNRISREQQQHVAASICEALQHSAAAR